MSRSAIYTANENIQTISDGGVLNLGTVVRRFGTNLQLSGNAIQLIGDGYYKVDMSITCAPAAIGTITATLLLDGLPVQGAEASESITTANNEVNLYIAAVVRVNGDNYKCFTNAANLTVRLSGVATTAVSNIGTTVIKL